MKEKTKESPSEPDLRPGEVRLPHVDALPVDVEEVLLRDVAGDPRSDVVVLAL